MDQAALQVVAQWGPLWLLAILTAWFLLPKVAEVVSAVGEARVDQHKLDGRILQALEHNTAVIDNNTAALKAVMALAERKQEQEQAVLNEIKCVRDDIKAHNDLASDIHTDQKIIATRIGAQR